VHRAADQHPSVHATTSLLTARTAVRPRQRVRTEPARELSASGMRWFSHLSHRLPDLQPGAHGQVVDRQVEVNNQLIAGELPALVVARDGRNCSTVHDWYLPERVRAAVGSAGGPGLVQQGGRVLPNDNPHWLGTASCQHLSYGNC